MDQRRDADASGSRPAHIGEVKALIYATRRVRIVHSESDSDDDEYHRGHRNLEMLGALLPGLGTEMISPSLAGNSLLSEGEDLTYGTTQLT